MLNAYAGLGGKENNWARGRDRGRLSHVLVILICAMIALGLSVSRIAQGQVVPAGDAGGLIVSAGGTGTGEYAQYGERKVVGVTAFVDLDSRRPIGLELEGH